MTKLQTTIVAMLLTLNCSCHPYGAFDQPQELVVDRNVTGSDFEASDDVASAAILRMP